MATTGFWYALTATPRRTRDAFSDPIRRLHILFRIVEGYVGGIATLAAWEGLLTRGFTWSDRLDILAILVLYPPIWLAALAAPLAEYLVYEFVFEPWAKWRVRRGKRSIVGPYYEGGPQDGEKFVNE